MPPRGVDTGPIEADAMATRDRGGGSARSRSSHSRLSSSAATRPCCSRPSCSPCWSSAVCHCSRSSGGVSVPRLCRSRSLFWSTRTSGEQTGWLIIVVVRWETDCSSCGLYLQATLAVARGRGAVVQHGAEQEPRMGSEPAAVVLLLGPAARTARHAAARSTWSQVQSHQR